MARTARYLIREHELEGMPSQFLVTAMGALAEAMSDRTERARADWFLTRRNLLLFDDVATWASVQSRIALARTSLLLANRADARVLLDEAQSQLRAQPDAIRPKAQLAELEELVRGVEGTAPWRSDSFTKAELRVLHYLPTNLTLAEISAQLFVSRNTAKSQVASIYRKLGTTSRRKPWSWPGPPGC